MKTTFTTGFAALLLILSGCSKEKTTSQTISIPNGDFENWDNTAMLENWKTNSCMFCVPPYETDIVRKDSSSYHGLFAAKFIYNGVYPAYAETKFPVQENPLNLKAFVKCTLIPSDTVSIIVRLFSNMALVDSAKWLGTSSIADYTEINVPITQSNSVIDSVYIRIQGGSKNNSLTNFTEFWVDNLFFER